MAGRLHPLYCMRVPCLLLAALWMPVELHAQQASWRWSGGVTVGALFGPGDIGRDRNAFGGHEQLIARWGDAAVVGGQVSLETRFGGLELRGVQATSAVQVRNEFGVAFPNHGKRPFAWSGGLLIYPLAPIEARRNRFPRPFLTAGLGGHFISVDLDNVKNQTLYHSFHWVLGGGVRIATAPEDVPSWTATFVEIRIERYRTWRNGPLDRFSEWTVTVGFGMRY